MLEVRGIDAGYGDVQVLFSLSLEVKEKEIVTLLGSAIPLRRASRYEPAPILRGE